MSEPTPRSEQLLLALSRYIGALERGEIEPLIEILGQAEHDPSLAQLLQEVHALYQQDEQIVVSELVARQAVQAAFPPLASGMPRLNGQRVHAPQRSELRERRFQHENKEIIMEERTYVMPLEKSKELPRPPRRGARLRWLSLVAAFLAICVLVAGMPVLLHMRGQAGGNGAQIQPPTAATATTTPQSGQSQYQTQAARLISQMSLDEEIGQLLMVEYTTPTYSNDLDYMLHTLHVGGVILYSLQLTSLQQAKSDITRMQQRAKIPLLISVDEEGCPYVERLQAIYGCHMNATQMGASGNPQVARQQGQQVSQQLAALGINVNLAPDVDVNQKNGFDMVTRTFGNTPDQVITYAGAYLQGLQGNGTIACLKHFPGLGAAVTDAHSTLPVVNSSKQQIYDTDLAPFKSLIQASDPLLNPGMIMSTDVLMPAIDPTYPAELSHTFMTDILRHEFHYNGVVLTDALYMTGISTRWNLNEAAILALQAGNDMLLGATDSAQASSMIQAIKQAVQSGLFSKANLDASVTRIIALKMQHHLLPTNA